MKMTAELRHRVHAVLVHAHRSRRSAAEIRAAANSLGPDADPQHEVRLDRDTVVHVWVEQHPEVGWCHRVRMDRRKRGGSALPHLTHVLSLMGLRPLLYDTDAVWRGKDQSLHVMQPLLREPVHR